MATKRVFEEIAANLHEARVLGLFKDDNAHRLVVENLAHSLEKLNPRFDGEKFEQACGVVPTVDELVKLIDSRPISIGYPVSLDEIEILSDCE